MTRPGYISGRIGKVGEWDFTSIMVLFDLLAITTHFSSSNATLQTASAGAVSSLTN
jgi:hypothetical protein